MLERSQLSIYARVTLIWGYPVSPKYPINIIRRRPPTFQASIFLLQSTHGLYSFCTLLNFWGHRNVCIGPQRFWQWWGWRLVMVRNMRSIYGFIKKKKTAVRVKSLYNTDFLTQKKITSFCSMFHIVFCFA